MFITFCRFEIKELYPWAVRAVSCLFILAGTLRSNLQTHLTCRTSVVRIGEGSSSPQKGAWVAETWLGFRVCVVWACSEPVVSLRWVPGSRYEVTFLSEVCQDFQRHCIIGTISLLSWKLHLLGKLALEVFSPALLWKSCLHLSSCLYHWSPVSWGGREDRMIQLSGVGSVLGTSELCWWVLEAHLVFPSLSGVPAEVGSWYPSFFVVVRKIPLLSF